MDDVASQRGIAQIAADLNEASELLHHASRSESEARRACTEALNKVNVLQREWDSAMAQLRKTAHTNTDWGQQARKQE